MFAFVAFDAVLVLIIPCPNVRWRGVKKTTAGTQASKTGASASDAGATAVMAEGTCQGGTKGEEPAAVTPEDGGQSGPTRHQMPPSSSEGPVSEAKPVPEAVRSRGRSKQDK